MIDKRECVFRFAKEVKSTLAFSKNKIARSPVWGLAFMVYLGYA